MDETTQALLEKIDKAETLEELDKLQAEVDAVKEEVQAEAELEAQKEKLKDELNPEVIVDKEDDKKDEDVVDISLDEERSLVKNVIEKRKLELKKVEERKNMEERELITKENVYGSKAYRSAFLKRLQKPERTDYTEEERAAMTTATTSAGYAIPTETLNAIEEVILAEAPLYGEVEVLNFAGYLSIPVEDTLNDASWVEEGTASTDSEDKLGNIAFAAYKLIKTVSITAEVEAMTVSDFENWIARRLGEKCAAAIDAAIVGGNGSGKPTGIVNDENVTKITKAISYATLCEMMGALKLKANAKVTINSNTLWNKVAQIVNQNGDPIFVPNANDGFSGKILGLNVIEDSNVEDDTVIVGNFKKYTLNFNKGITIDKDTSVDFRSGNTVYRGMALVDGKVRNKNAFVVLQAPASI